MGQRMMERKCWLTVVRLGHCVTGGEVVGQQLKVSQNQKCRLKEILEWMVDHQ